MADSGEGEQTQQRRQYKVGEDIFYFQQQIGLNLDRCHGPSLGGIRRGVMMDDGRVVLTSVHTNRLEIFNIDTSLVYNIPIQGMPFDITAVNDFTVAVTFELQQCVKIFDIDKKMQIKSIPVPGECWSIVYINKTFVVGFFDWTIKVIDDQTTNVVQTIKTDTVPYSMDATANKITYGDIGHTKELHFVSYSGEKLSTIDQPGYPSGITTLQDGSVYVIFRNGEVQHVSSDGQMSAPVTTNELKLSEGFNAIGYNHKRRNLFICSVDGLLKIFCEI